MYDKNRSVSTYKSPAQPLPNMTPNMFPLLYHTHHNLYKEDLPFWLELAARHGDPVLELGCGSGRVLLALAQDGYHVYGLDNDPGMLTILQENLTPDLLPRTHILRAEFTSFHLERRFPLIILTCNTFSTLSTRQRQTTIERVHRHLCSGGIFATSLPNPSFLKRIPQRSDPEVEDVFPHPVDGEPVQVSSNWERTPEHFTVRWFYDHLLPDGSVDRTLVQVCHNLVPIQAYIDVLNNAGMQMLDIFGDFDKSPHSDDSPFLVLTVTR